ncbi:MAG: alpha/beta hydrolase [Chloroflexota bacterium]
MQIVLIHGQGRTPAAMSILAWRLRQHKVIQFGYVCAYQTFEQIVERFVRRIRNTTDSEPYIIVAHSLGGLITRASLPYLEDHLPEHVIMLGTPNQPAAWAKKVGHNPLYRFYTGDCGQKLSQPHFYETLPLPNVATTIVAGTKGLKGDHSPFGDQPNDMIVAVEETKLGPDTPIVEISTVHTFMMNKRGVAKIINTIIKDLEQPHQTLSMEK